MKRTIIKSLIALSLCFTSVNAFANSNALQTYGDIGQVAIPVVAGAISVLKGDTTGLVQLLKVSGLTLVLVHILKPLDHEVRPNGGSDSFPSGHTASAFMGAAFLQQRYGWKLGIPAYLLASAVGYSRIDANKHWPIDVLSGAAIAIIANLTFTSRYHKAVTVAPVVSKDFTGIDVNANFNA